MTRSEVLMLIIACASIVLVVCLLVLYLRLKLEMHARNLKDYLQSSVQKAKQHDGCIMRLSLNKEAEARISLAQVLTQADSPDDVLTDALDFYCRIIERYRDGFRLFIGKPLSGKRYPVTFKSLDVVGKRIES